MTSPEALNAAILMAHDDEDTATLVNLYAQAADQAEESGDIDAACFFLTQAYVFALDSGHSMAPYLHQRLLSHGREE
ncbi:MAG: hypothetical protein AAGC81_14285 [Pseudomonadota bacterium]